MLRHAALAVPVLLAAQAPPTWEALEARGAVVAGIDVEVDEVFDLSQPKENHRLGRYANALHRTTRPWAVRQHLVFREGEPVSASRIRESERALRSQSFAAEVVITPVVAEDGSVRARVRVRDAWTLLVVGNVKRVGGTTTWATSLQDANVLGTGRSLALWREKGLERSAFTVGFQDPKLFGTHWNLDTYVQRLSDGHGWSLGLARPFYALDTPWAFDVRAATWEYRITEFWDGQEVWGRQTRQVSGELGFDRRLARRGRAVHRLGLALRADEATYGPLEALGPGPLPVHAAPDRQLRGLQLRWSVAEDRWEVFRDLAFARRAEDVNLGWDATLAVGRHLRRLGSTEDAPFLELGARKGFRATERTVAILRTGLTGRLPSGAWENGRFQASLVAYNQDLPRQTLAGRVAWDATFRPDFGKLLYLSGVDGFRGYGKYLLAGDRRWLVSLEDRIHMGWEPWGLARIGLVVLADVGAVRRLDTGAWSATHGTVGAGFRVAVLKSGLSGAFNLAVAVPTRRQPGEAPWQLIIGSTLGY